MNIPGVAAALRALADAIEDVEPPAAVAPKKPARQASPALKVTPSVEVPSAVQEKVNEALRKKGYVVT